MFITKVKIVVTLGGERGYDWGGGLTQFHSWSFYSLKFMLFFKIYINVTQSLH